MEDKEDTTTKTGSKVKSHDQAGKVTGSRVESPDEEETMIKRGSRVESPDEEETMIKRGNRVEPPDKEATMIKRGSRVKSPDKEETMIKRGNRVESPDEEETMIKTGSRVESPDKEETMIKRGNRVESPDKEETMIKRGSRVESPDEEETTIKTGSNVEFHGKEEIKSKAGVMTKATSQFNLLKKCAHGHMVGQCAICFKLINGLENRASRRGWHICIICHMGFRDLVMHMNHLIKFHKNVAPTVYKCPICDAHVEGNRVMEHVKLHDTNVVQNHLVSICNSSASHSGPSKVKSHKSSDASSAISTPGDSSRLINCIHTRTASKPAREKLTEMTSNSVKEQGEDPLRMKAVQPNSSQETSSECREVIPGSALCHICGVEVENIVFEEHIRNHDKEITLDPDVPDTAHGTLRNTQVHLCNLSGTDVTSDAFEQHVKQHQNPTLTSSYDIACKLSSGSDTELLEPRDFLEKHVTEDKIPSSSGKMEILSCRVMCSEAEVPGTVPASFQSSELKYAEYCKEQLRLVKEYSVGCCYHQKDKEENADHWLFNEMCGWHMCSSCNMGFHGHQLYWEHLLQDHNIEKLSTSVCTACGSTVESEDLQMHMKAHERDETYVENDPGLLDDKRFSCSNCSKSFSSFSMFRDHIKEHKQVVNIKELPLDFHQCNVCGSHVLGEDNLSAHMNLHLAVESPNDCCTSLFRCKICSISFPSNKCFMSHMTRWHLKQFDSNTITKLYLNEYAVTVYKCVCYSLFVDILDFKRHVQKKHPEALRERIETEKVETNTSVGLIVDEVSGHTQTLVHSKNTQANNRDIDMRRKSNVGMLLYQEKESTERTPSKELACKDTVSDMVSSANNSDDDDESDSSCPVEMDYNFCSSSETADAWEEAKGRDYSFRVVREESGKSESKNCTIENMSTLDMEGKVCGLELEDDNRTKTQKDQAGYRDSTQNTNVVGVDLAADGGAQDAAMSKSEVNMFRATSNIAPLVKVIRCDKDGAMVKVFGQGLEGYYSCSRCGKIFKNENDFVRHCQVKMTHKILRTVHHKNLSVRNRAANEGSSESSSKSDSYVVASTGGSDISLSLCSCGKLLVGQEDLDRHLQAYRTPDIVGSPYRLRNMMCDCGTQTKCDHMSCQGHTAVSRLQDRTQVRQLDKCVMVDEEDINVTLSLFLDENMDDANSVVETKKSGVSPEKVNCIRRNGSTDSNCTKENGPILSDDAVKKKHSASNRNVENGPVASNIRGENEPSILNIERENGPCASMINKENGLSISNISRASEPPCVSNFGESTNLSEADNNTGSEFMVKRIGPACDKADVSFSESLLTSERTLKGCSSEGHSMSTSSSSSSAQGKVQVHMCSLCRMVLLQKEDMAHHLSRHKSYICLCSVLFLDFASFMRHAQMEHKMCASDQNPVFVNLLGPKPQIISRPEATNKRLNSLTSENVVSTESESEEMLDMNAKFKGYFACGCHEIFVTESDYHDHLRQVYSKGKHGRKAIEDWHHCAICPMAFANRLDYMQHLDREHRKKGHPVQISESSQKTATMVRCEDCGIIFDNMACLKVHRQLYQEMYKCTHHQVRTEMTRGRMVDRGVSLTVDKPGTTPDRITKDSAMLALQNDSQYVKMGTKDGAMLASKNDSQALEIGTKDGAMLASKNDSQALEIGVPIPKAKVATAIKHDLDPDPASDFTVQKKIDTCAKACEMFVIDSDGKTVIKTESGAENAVVTSDSIIITRNEDVNDDDDDDDNEDFSKSEDDADDNRHDAMESDPERLSDENPSVIITPGFGFIGSDSTKWTMMVPMVTIKKEPEECMESLGDSQSVLGGGDIKEDIVKTEVKLEPADPETGFKLMENGVGAEPYGMLTMSCGDLEDDWDSVQVKEEPVSDEDLSQSAVGNMVYIHKSSRDIFDEHEPEAQEQLCETARLLKPAEQQVSQQHSMAKLTSVKQQLVAKLQVEKQQKELAKLQAVKQQTIANPRTVKQQLFIKRQLGEQQVSQQHSMAKQKSVRQEPLAKLQVEKQQKELAKLQAVKQQTKAKPRTVKQQLFIKRQLGEQLWLVPESVKEDPSTDKLQPEKRRRSETLQPVEEERLTNKRAWIQIQPKTKTLESSLPVSNSQFSVTRQLQPMIQTQTLINLQQQVAQQQPTVKLQTASQKQPMVKMKTLAPHQTLAAQQPVVKLQAATQQQLLAKLKGVEKQQPIVKLQAAIQPQPKVKQNNLAPQQPLVKCQAATRKQRKVKLKTQAPEPMLKLQKVVKLQSLMQEQMKAQQKQLFKFHVVTEQPQVKKVKGLLQQEVVKTQSVAPSPYACGICNDAFKTPEALIVHVKTHSKKMHELNNHNGGNVFLSQKVALECKDTCSTDKSYGCPVCNETFPQSCQLLAHLQTHQVHKEGNAAMCVVCGSQFKQASSLRKHMHCHMRESGKGLTELVAKVDPALMPVAESYPCEKCGLVFRSKNRKAVHVRYVHKQMEPNKCLLCEKTFYSPSELERHMRTHTGEKPFGCDQCGKAFALSTTLKDHLRSHTGERPFKCSICFKAYSSSSILGRHKLTHVGERKFKCDICDKSFLYSNSLTVHMRTHTGDRPFTCTICGKTFTASCHYRVHMRIHTGEKPYKCTFCEKQFNNYGSHYRHIRTHQEWKCSEEEDEQEEIPDVLEVKQEVTSIDSEDEVDLEAKLVPLMLSSGLKSTFLQTQGVPDKSKEDKQKVKRVSLLAPRTNSNSDAHMNPANLGSVSLEMCEPLKPAKAGSRKQHIKKSTVYARVITAPPSQLTPSDLAPPSVNENLKRQLTGTTTFPQKTETAKRRKTETRAILNKSPSTSGIIAQLLLSQKDS